MSDTFITIATFNKTFEAQLAKNLLESEGIEALVGGAFSSDMLFGSIAVGDQIVLQVREEDAQRAAGVLAAVAAARLEEDWEDQAESGTGVWICSICGEPISNRLSVCYSCQTPREGIRAGTPRDLTAIQPNPAMLPTSESVQKRDEIADAPTPAPSLAPPTTEEEESVQAPTARGDDLAYKAFLASLAGAVMPIVFPIAWICLLRVIVSSSDMSVKGLRQFYGALLINGSFVVVMLFFCAGGWRFF